MIDSSDQRRIEIVMEEHQNTMHIVNTLAVDGRPFSPESKASVIMLMAHVRAAMQIYAENEGLDAIDVVIVQCVLNLLQQEYTRAFDRLQKEGLALPTSTSYTKESR